MPAHQFTPEDSNILSFLLDGRGQVSITHDRPPNGPWFIEITDTWTDMIMKLFSHPDLSVTLIKVAEKKAKVLGVDLDEILFSSDEETEETEEEDE